MKNETDSGRTLVEMLGVLAMAGVLSVIGVMGYRLAIDKNKANTLVNQAQQRAVIVMEQMTLNRPLSLQEFSSLNKTPAGTFGQATTQGLTKQFGIQVFGVEKRVCENILNMIGENTPLRRLSYEASPTVAITQCGLSNDFLMVYNQEMKGAPEDTLYCTDDTDCSSENECMMCEEESKSCQNKCQNLDYLESTGTQYIDTGLRASLKSEFDFEVEFTKNTNSAVFGSRLAQTSHSCTFFNIATYNYLRFDYNDQTQVAYPVGSTRNGHFRIKTTQADRQTVLVEDVSTGAQSTTTLPLPREVYELGNMYLFATNTNDSRDVKSSFRMFHWARKDKGALVRDFTPVLAPNGQPALFDQVEKKLYYNKGSGAFLYPEPTN